MQPRDWNALGQRVGGWFPPANTFDPASAWTLTYTHEGLTPGRDGWLGGQPGGSLIVAHTPHPAGRHIKITEQIDTVGTSTTTMAEFHCANDTLLTPRRWNLDIHWESKMPLVSVAGLDQKRAGRVENNELVLTAAKEHRRRAPQHWTASWLLFAVLPHLPFASETRLHFDLLEEAELFKPDQQLTYIGKQPLALGGKNLSLHVFEQVGRGVLPTRWWLDDQHRVVLAASERHAYLLDARAKGVAS
ncbi:MAG: hypothetical protein EPN23_04755 [Verrucomicrobia bacterium]|nr:MAG: hypothetical protein EPN23_04755 [Verrucomicrobiota bacterium]